MTKIMNKGKVDVKKIGKNKTLITPAEEEDDGTTIANSGHRSTYSDYSLGKEYDVLDPDEDVEFDEPEEGNEDLSISGPPADSTIPANGLYLDDEEEEEAPINESIENILNESDFKEEEHPRDGGKFTTKGGGDTGKKEEEDEDTTFEKSHAMQPGQVRVNRISGIKTQLDRITSDKGKAKAEKARKGKKVSDMSNKELRAYYIKVGGIESKATERDFYTSNKQIDNQAWEIMAEEEFGKSVSELNNAQYDWIDQIMHDYGNDLDRSKKPSSESDIESENLDDAEMWIGAYDTMGMSVEDINNKLKGMAIPNVTIEKAWANYKLNPTKNRNFESYAKEYISHDDVLIEGVTQWHEQGGNVEADAEEIANQLNLEWGDQFEDHPSGKFTAQHVRNVYNAIKHTRLGESKSNEGGVGSGRKPEGGGSAWLSVTPKNLNDTHGYGVWGDADTSVLKKWMEDQKDNPEQADNYKEVKKELESRGEVKESYTVKDDRDNLFASLSDLDEATKLAETLHAMVVNEETAEIMYVSPIYGTGADLFESRANESVTSWWGGSGQSSLEFRSKVLARAGYTPVELIDKEFWELPDGVQDKVFELYSGGYVGEAKLKSGYIQCPHCDQQFSNIQWLSDHINERHEGKEATEVSKKEWEYASIKEREKMLEDVGFGMMARPKGETNPLALKYWKDLPRETRSMWGYYESYAGEAQYEVTIQGMDGGYFKTIVNAPDEDYAVYQARNQALTEKGEGYYDDTISFVKGVIRVGEAKANEEEINYRPEGTLYQDALDKAERESNTWVKQLIDSMNKNKLTSGDKNLLASFLGESYAKEFQPERQGKRVKLLTGDYAGQTGTIATVEIIGDGFTVRVDGVHNEYETGVNASPSEVEFLGGEVNYGANLVKEAELEGEATPESDVEELSKLNQLYHNEEEEQAQGEDEEEDLELVSDLMDMELEEIGTEEFKEDEHPREDSGKFTSGGGGSGGKHSDTSTKDIIKSIKGGNKDWHSWGRNEKTEELYAELERRNREVPKPTSKLPDKVFRDDPDAVSKMEKKVKYWEDQKDYWSKIIKFPNRDYQTPNQLGDARWFMGTNISTNLRDAKKKLEGIKAQQGRGTDLIRKPTYKDGKKRFYYSEEPKGEPPEETWQKGGESYSVINDILNEVDFKEDEHPRADDGQFTSGGGGKSELNKILDDPSSSKQERIDAEKGLDKKDDIPTAEPKKEPKKEEPKYSHTKPNNPKRFSTIKNRVLKALGEPKDDWGKRYTDKVEKLEGFPTSGYQLEDLSVRYKAPILKAHLLDQHPKSKWSVKSEHFSGGSAIDAGYKGGEYPYGASEIGDVYSQRGAGYDSQTDYFPIDNYVHVYDQREDQPRADPQTIAKDRPDRLWSWVNLKFDEENEYDMGRQWSRHIAESIIKGKGDTGGGYEGVSDEMMGKIKQVYNDFVEQERKEKAGESYATEVEHNKCPHCNFETSWKEGDLWQANDAKKEMHSHLKAKHGESFKKKLSEFEDSDRPVSPNSLMRYTEPIDLPTGKNAMDQTYGVSEPETPDGQDLTGITVGEEEIIEKKPPKIKYYYYKQYPFGRRAGKQNPFGEANEVDIRVMNKAHQWWDSKYPSRQWKDMGIGERQNVILAFLRDPDTKILEAKEFESPIRDQYGNPYPTPEGIADCTFCGKVFDNWDLLGDHITIVHNDGGRTREFYDGEAPSSILNHPDWTGYAGEGGTGSGRKKEYASKTRPDKAHVGWKNYGIDDYLEKAEKEYEGGEEGRWDYIEGDDGEQEYGDDSKRSRIRMEAEKELLDKTEDSRFPVKGGMDYQEGEERVIDEPRENMSPSELGDWQQRRHKEYEQDQKASNYLDKIKYSMDKGGAKFQRGGEQFDSFPKKEELEEQLEDPTPWASLAHLGATTVKDILFPEKEESKELSLSDMTDEEMEELGKKESEPHKAEDLAEEGGRGSGKKDHKQWMRAIEEEHTYDFCENCNMITEQVNNKCDMCGKKVE